MDSSPFNKLHADGLISDESFQKIEQKQQHPLFSVYWELKTLLYLGVVLLTSGLGTIVYKNIDTIGHQIILLLIALIFTGCFIYCFRLKKPFQTAKVDSPNSFFDYILLLGTICFTVFVGYLQYQYSVFGTHYGIATLITMLVLFYIAYDFDHAGILTMAIINLGVWMGVSVTPKQLLTHGNFDSQTIIFTYLALGFILLAAAWATQKFSIKPHFKFSYLHYGVHVCFITMLAGYFHNYDEGTPTFWLICLLGLAAVIYIDAFKQKSFYFLLLTVLYSYFAISCIIVRWAITIPDYAGIWLLFFYFIGSAIGFVFFLIHINKKLKAA